MGVESYNKFSKSIQGPPRTLKDISIDGLKFMLRGISYGLTPNYNKNTTKEEINKELKRRKLLK